MVSLSTQLSVNAGKFFLIEGPTTAAAHFAVTADRNEPALKNAELRVLDVHGNVVYRLGDRLAFNKEYTWDGRNLYGSRTELGTHLTLECSLEYENGKKSLQTEDFVLGAALRPDGTDYFIENTPADSFEEQGDDNSGMFASYLEKSKYLVSLLSPYKNAALTLYGCVDISKRNPSSRNIAGLKRADYFRRLVASVGFPMKRIRINIMALPNPNPLIGHVVFKLSNFTVPDASVGSATKAS